VKGTQQLGGSTNHKNNLGEKKGGGGRGKKKPENPHNGIWQNKKEESSLKKDAISGTGREWVKKGDTDTKEKIA